ncbi:PrsW family intramembrane metalloprotease [Actinocatenispora sera]|uniref:Protease PrsW n=1 Tax=Actinocatenispora sera TaxID=390989 RepID=A0A810KTS3_9ACTN|nr:PrsW family intramembrane metalloprotease [Actinocatenispora sera]BCJ26633.1 protease PrsW [Actinocatenispora sera]
MGTGGHPFGPPVVAVLDAPKRGRFDWVRLWKMTGVIAPIVVGALVLILAVGTNIGPKAFAIGLAVAVIPVPFLVGCFLWLDRYEPEPWKYLAFVFGWGACVATSAALGVNTLGSYLFEQAGMSGNADAVLVAPFIEETMKALGPVLLLYFFHRKKRQPINVVDGIIYFGLSATGFAMAENILYLGGIYVTGSKEGGAVTGALMVVMLFVVRIGISGFAHPLFTSMTGIGFGLAARARDRRVRYLAPLAGWFAAMSLHSTWNLISTLGPQALLTGYAVVMAPIFFAAVGVALWARGRQGRQMARMLRPYVPAGWLSPPELAALATMTRRMAARRWAKRVAGPQGARAMEEYQFALSTLALARDSALAGFGADTFAERERELLTKAIGLRQVFTGRDRTVPPAFWDGVNYHIRFPDGTVRQLPPPQRPVVPVPVLTGYPHPGQGWW